MSGTRHDPIIVGEDQCVIVLVTQDNRKNYATKMLKKRTTQITLTQMPNNTVIRAMDIKQKKRCDGLDFGYTQPSGDNTDGFF
ncbi:AtpC [Acrasis kona]|uniref:AtpC n=1 Tax=Acrasis kona TaxID=1008807 RepID=A0AAW2ZNT6_9EUKA